MPPFPARHLIDDIDKVFIIVTRATAAAFRPLANLWTTAHFGANDQTNGQYTAVSSTIIAVMALASFPRILIFLNTLTC